MSTCAVCAHRHRHTHTYTRGNHEAIHPSKDMLYFIKLWEATVRKQMFEKNIESTFCAGHKGFDILLRVFWGYAVMWGCEVIRLLLSRCFTRRQLNYYLHHPRRIIDFIEDKHSTNCSLSCELSFRSGMKCSRLFCLQICQGICMHKHARIDINTRTRTPGTVLYMYMSICMGPNGKLIVQLCRQAWHIFTYMV